MTQLVERAEVVNPISPAAVRWTREMCDDLERAGILNYRYELVDGVINRMSQYIRHGIMVRLIMEWLSLVFGGPFVVSQVTIDVRPEDNPTNAPEPDAIVLARPAEEFTANPTPDEILLCIEAAHTTAAYDRSTKAALYARAGIAEYWVIDLLQRRMHVYRRPASGAYRDLSVYDENDIVAPLSKPDASVHVSQFLPAVQPTS